MGRFTLHDRFGYRVAVLARRWRQLIDVELESYGLSQATWRPLIHLATFDEPPRQCELADALQLGCPALVRLLDRLEAKELVERVEVDGDRRAKQVRLTPAGRELAARVHDIIVAIERRLMSELADSEIARCTRAFDSIEHQIDRSQRAARRRA